ncbi:hypothetical protein DM02DRAFT_613278 [Periconia macrospinosa]|uniref:Uncharacterized protein n=1 Tax=Periconia macrospinosa TaxID=97972 RepID=A0A2V1DUV5_9PLEO|nr:hypothetical protein DM02DRAFT_613278 [Periconia macrospinosa]
MGIKSNRDGKLGEVLGVDVQELVRDGCAMAMGSEERDGKCKATGTLGRGRGNGEIQPSITAGKTSSSAVAMHSNSPNRHFNDKTGLITAKTKPPAPYKSCTSTPLLPPKCPPNPSIYAKLDPKTDSKSHHNVQRANKDLPIGFNQPLLGVPPSALAARGEGPHHGTREEATKRIPRRPVPVRKLGS